MRLSSIVKKVINLINFFGATVMKKYLINTIITGLSALVIVSCSSYSTGTRSDYFGYNNTPTVDSYNDQNNNQNNNYNQDDNNGSNSNWKNPLSQSDNNDYNSNYDNNSGNVDYNNNNGDAYVNYTSAYYVPYYRVYAAPRYVPVVMPWWDYYYDGFYNRYSNFYISLGWGVCSPSPYSYWDWYNPYYDYNPYYGIAWGGWYPMAYYHNHYYYYNDYYNHHFYHGGSYIPDKPRTVRTFGPNSGTFSTLRNPSTGLVSNTPRSQTRPSSSSTSLGGSNTPKSTIWGISPNSPQVQRSATGFSRSSNNFTPSNSARSERPSVTIPQSNSSNNNNKNNTNYTPSSNNNNSGSSRSSGRSSGSSGSSNSGRSGRRSDSEINLNSNNLINNNSSQLEFKQSTKSIKSSYNSSLFENSVKSNRSSRRYINNTKWNESSVDYRAANTRSGKQNSFMNQVGKAAQSGVFGNFRSNSSARSGGNVAVPKSSGTVSRPSSPAPSSGSSSGSKSSSERSSTRSGR